MKIKNIEAIALTPGRRDALAIAEAGLQAIDTERIVRETVRLEGKALRVRDDTISLEGVSRIFVAAVGKCAVEAGRALEAILGERLTGGAVLDVKEGKGLTKLTAYRGTHPLPSEENRKATERLIALLTPLAEDDLVIFVISGGGSVLLALPERGEVAEEVKVTQHLIRAGATIAELNTVRKHLSYARGGYLAKYAYPARVLSLIFSDVPGNDVSVVSSGPTVKDATTIKDAAAIVEKYDVLRFCNIARCGLVETPKEEKYFEKAMNVVLVSNDMALEAMRREAERTGYHVAVCTNCLTGEAEEVAMSVVQELRKSPSRTVLLYGGETTVTVRGNGRGGRNLELALSALRAIQRDEVMLSIATDGRDHGEFAGAIADVLTREHAEKLGLTIELFLEENNEYPFFEKTGDYLFTGDTGSNVSDLLIALKL